MPDRSRPDASGPPSLVGLCPGEHLGEFYMPLVPGESTVCPMCDEELVVYAPTAAMLAEFHAHPNSLHEGTNTQALRRTLHEEEHLELMEELAAAARGEADLRQIARELADVVYVTYGSAWAFGIDLDAAVAEIHRAAMDKMRAGLRRADGKILKPPGFVPPDMACAVRHALGETADAR